MIKRNALIVKHNISLGPLRGPGARRLRRHRRGRPQDGHGAAQGPMDNNNGNHTNNDYDYDNNNDNDDNNSNNDNDDI